MALKECWILLAVRFFDKRWWNKMEKLKKWANIYFSESIRLSQHCSIPGRITNRRRENYFLMVLFMTVSQPAMFKRNAKDERTMAHIFCKYFETFLDDIRARFVSLFETSICIFAFQDYFAKVNRFGMINNKEGLAKKKIGRVVFCDVEKESRNYTRKSLAFDIKQTLFERKRN